LEISQQFINEDRNNLSRASRTNFALVSKINADVNDALDSNLTAK
jgi:hypothetical protein